MMSEEPEILTVEGMRRERRKRPALIRWWWAFNRWRTSAYYWCRAIPFPHNRQKIRNVPRTWIDRSERIVHCVFSMLCDFVERECYDYDTKTRGRDALALRVEWLKNEPMSQGQYENEREILALYDWYVGRDWENAPFGMKHPSDRGNDEEWAAYFKAENAFEDEQTEMAIRALKTRGGWWT